MFLSDKSFYTFPRVNKLIIASKTIAPIVPVKISPTTPSPNLPPNNQYPINPPTIPTTIFPINPRLPPLKICDPNQPAIAPIINVHKIPIILNFKC